MCGPLVAARTIAVEVVVRGSAVGHVEHAAVALGGTLASSMSSRTPGQLPTKGGRLREVFTAFGGVMGESAGGAAAVMVAAVMADQLRGCARCDALRAERHRSGKLVAGLSDRRILKSRDDDSREPAPARADAIPRTHRDRGGVRFGGHARPSWLPASASS